MSTKMWAIWTVWDTFWILLIACIGLGTGGGWNRRKAYGNETEMIARLLNSYDVRLRPNFGAEPLYIGIETSLDSFLQVSEVDMDYTITIYLNQYWKDERLAFSTGDEMLTLSGDFAEKIWVPDTFFANDKQSFLHDVTEKNKMVRLHADGSIIYGMKFTTTLSCQMDLHYYPLDSQNCTVEIESYGYTVRDLRMYWRDDAVMGVNKVKPPQFKIVGIQTNDRTEELSTGAYQRLSLSFKLKREMSYFIFQTYLPSILIVMLSWIAFWINHEATAARVALGITTVLTMTTLSSAVRASLPRISYVKAIDIYLVMCFVFVFAALLEYATVNNTFWEKKMIPPPKIKPAEAKPKPKGKLVKKPTIQIDEIPTFKTVKTKAVDVSGEESAKTAPSTSIKTDTMKRLTVQDPLCSIEVVDTSLPGIPRIARSTSFSGMTATTSLNDQQRNPFVGGNVFPAFEQRFPKRKSVWRKRKLGKSIRRSVKALEHYIPDIKQDVNIIDKFSRVAFPSAFILFNIGYWGFYHEWNSVEIK